LVILACVSAAACGTDQPDPPLAQAGSGGNATTATGGVVANALLDRVVDGDTLIVKISGKSEKVRLIGINTPESVDPRRPVECFGKEASAHMEQLLGKGTKLRLERDVEARDQYGRLLAYVYRAADGKFINLAMVDDGFAHTYTFPPNVAHRDDLATAERRARSAGIGLWGACPASPTGR
jgi:micrococcal nuclease